MEQYDRLRAGKLYSPDETITALKIKARTIIQEYNQTKETEKPRRQELLKDLLGTTGEQFTIKPPFYCSHGKHIHVGENFFCNFNCIFLDLNEIHIGKNVLIGPRVSIYTALHPIDAAIRATGLEYALPVEIGDDVWIAGDVVINPGVKIGNGSIIGSGSVVTKDIPENCIAFGNPCKVHRPITQADTDYWQSQKEEYFDLNEIAGKF